MVLAIAASLLVGFTLSTLAYRYRYLHVPGQSVVARMNHDLHLNPAQREQIIEIMQDTRLRVMQMRNRLQHARRGLLLQAYEQIRATLTPEQQNKFDREFALPAMRGAAVPQSNASPAAAPSAQPAPE
jgi:Spy/CpxP family protein refolding chaperone